ncbi:MAPEG family protein [Phenylobacterium deserti]|uniref:Glutathione S-transferase n=1 Tax=Phenylobacterium deserti TaxID=1914756 RepID=A0A328AS61_9CAUL|nr:MAPEG family protein [Phenylobacterium deserti]RAK57892.1 glutathione S-transferase [Phenylobacterium deserti]
METLPAAHAAALWAGLNLVLLLTLSVLVVRQRRQHRVALGDGGVPQLAQAIRAFGNASEYIPAALAGFAILTLAGAPPLVVHASGLLLFAGRVAHAVGLTRSSGASIGRAGGLLFTWLGYIVAAVALLFYAIP